jgi:hypothetical protein
MNSVLEHRVENISRRVPMRALLLHVSQQRIDGDSGSACQGTVISDICPSTMVGGPKTRLTSLSSVRRLIGQDNIGPSHVPYRLCHCNLRSPTCSLACSQGGLLGVGLKTLALSTVLACDARCYISDEAKRAVSSDKALTKLTSSGPAAVSVRLPASAVLQRRDGFVVDHEASDEIAHTSLQFWEASAVI